MKKAIKKFMAALLAAAMLCAMAVPAAFAANNVTNGKITVKNTVIGKTYTIYQILAIDSHNNDYSALNYKATAEWENFVRDNSHLTADSQGYVTWDGDEDADSVKAFASEAKDYAKDKTPADTKVANSSTVEFDNLPLGYYLVVSDLGVLCSLNTTKPNVEVVEKNGAPTADKTVKNASGSYDSGNDAGVGDTVEYKVVITVNDGDPQNYVLHDTMTGLTFNSGSVTILKNNDVFTSYAVVTNTDDNCTFEIHFNKGSLATNDVLTVTYSATVSANAVIGNAGNPNDIHLDYGNDGHTSSSGTKTYVWSFDIFKYTEKDGKNQALAGAQFILYKVEGDAKQYAVIVGDTLTGWTKNKEDATTLTSPDNGKLSIKGLNAGTYYLEETKAPDGYNTLEAPITVTIEANNAHVTGTASAKILQNGDDTDGTIKVLNNTGATLPSTGGIGTTIFYVIGGGLMVAAIVLLVTKKRMENK